MVACANTSNQAWYIIQAVKDCNTWIVRLVAGKFNNIRVYRLQLVFKQYTFSDSTLALMAFHVILTAQIAYSQVNSRFVYLP